MKNVFTIIILGLFTITVFAQNQADTLHWSPCIYFKADSPLCKEVKFGLNDTIETIWTSGLDALYDTSIRSFGEDEIILFSMLFHSDFLGSRFEEVAFTFEEEAIHTDIFLQNELHASKDILLPDSLENIFLSHIHRTLPHSYTIRYCGYCSAPYRWQKFNFFMIILIKEGKIYSRYDLFWPRPGNVPLMEQHDTKVKALGEILNILAKKDDSIRLIMRLIL